MERHQIHRAASTIIELHQLRNPLRLPHEPDPFLVDGQAVKPRAMLGGKSLQAIQRLLLLKHLGITLDRPGGIKNAGATTGGFLRCSAMGGRVGAQEKTGPAGDRRPPQGQAMALALGHRQAIEIRPQPPHGTSHCD